MGDLLSNGHRFTTPPQPSRAAPPPPLLLSNHAFSRPTVPGPKSATEPRRLDSTRFGAGLTGSGVKRRSSLDFLRRPRTGAYHQPFAAPDLTHLAITRITQAHEDDARAQFQPQRQQQHIDDSQPSSPAGRTFSFSRRFGTDGKMLRKSSRHKAAQLEQERLAREKALKFKEAPRLPAPDISSFADGVDDRDSIAIFDSAGFAASSQNATAHSSTNFSRPHATVMHATSNASLNSAAYKWHNAASSSPRQNGEPVVDPYARTESMTNRGRYSYASSATGMNVNSPRRVRRRKDPTPFNVLVIGAKNSGKTSFISFLRHSLTLPSHKQPTPHEVAPTQESIGSFESHYLETEIEGERIGVTLWDSAGFEKSIVDLQLREMTAFVESKFEETFIEEQKVMRSPGVQDTHIHCVFMVLDPSRLDTNIAESNRREGTTGLDDSLDLQVIRALWGKTTVIPVISKADTLTVRHMAYLKRTVSESLKRCKLDPLEALEFEDDEEEDTIEEEDEEAASVKQGSEQDQDEQVALPKAKRGHNRQSSISATIATAAANNDETPYLPMSILSPDPYELPPYAPAPPEGEKVGRHFAWGFADPYDSRHCDFIRLRDSIFTEWRGDLRDLAQTKWYENWRTSRLRNLPSTKQRSKGAANPASQAIPEPRSTSASSAGRANASAVPRSVANTGAVTGVPIPMHGGPVRPVQASS